jgi:hypothetical protein
MKRTANKALFVVGLLSACTGVDSDAEDPNVGNAELGIVEFATTETASDLHIRGLAADGSVVGEYRLHVGVVPVDYMEETTLARVIDFWVKDITFEQWTSGGVEAITPPLSYSDADLFVTDPYVSRVLARWGIVYTDLEALREVGLDDETAYACIEFSHGCQSSSQDSSCSQQYDSFGHFYPVIYRCTSDLSKRWTAACGWQQGQTTPCGTAGPGGCGSCPSPETNYDGDAKCSSGSCAWLAVCGNGNCDSSMGETTFSCNQDCGPWCPSDCVGRPDGTSCGTGCIATCWSGQCLP